MKKLLLLFTLFILLFFTTSIFAGEITVEFECNWDVQTSKKRDCIPGVGCALSYKCNWSALNPWQVGYDEDGNTTWWHSMVTKWDVSIPSNAVVTKIKVDYYVKNVNPGSSLQNIVTEYSSNPENDNCSTRWNTVDGETEYITYNFSENQWNLVTLPASAITEFNKHRDWFAIGVKPYLIMDDYITGFDNSIKGYPAKLYITYYLRQQIFVN